MQCLRFLASSFDCDDVFSLESSCLNLRLKLHYMPFQPLTVEQFVLYVLIRPLSTSQISILILV